MDAEKISGIVNDIILESGARTSYTLDDGAVRTVGKAKGRPNAVSVRVKVDSNMVLLDVVPAADGCTFVATITAPNATEERLKVLAQEALEGVIRINRWNAQ